MKLPASKWWVLLAPVALPLLGAEAFNSVTAVRHWSVGGIVRVVVEVSGDFEFRSDRLHNPERVYFDILNARPWFDNRRLFLEELDDKLLKRVRVAETVPGITRVVLELGDGVESSTSELINPHRLIIELRAAAAPALPPITSALPPPTPATVSAPPSKPAGSSKTELPRAETAVEIKPAAASIDNTPAPVERAAALEPSKAPITPETASAPAIPGRETKRDTGKSDAPSPPASSSAELAQSARHNSNGQNSLTRALGLKINRIVIDPGHGGHDEGTMGAKSLLEKDLVLDVSKRLGKLIEERMGAEVIYTRTDDTFVPLEGRTALANEKKADLFLSIHANSSPVPSVAGIETYYLNLTDSKEALDIAARENTTSERSVFDLQDIIQKITQHDKAQESREFAGRVQSSLFAFSARNNPAEKNRGVRRAPFVVLIGANMPSILAEIGFLSNPKEEALLTKPEYRQKLAEALYRGMSRYVESLSHYQLALN